MAFDRAVHSLRILRRHKRFTVLAVLSLGVAIALNTTMYSVLDAMIKPKLAIHEPDRLYEAPYYGDYRRRVPIREQNREVAEFLTFHAGVAGTRGTGMGNAIERGSHIRDARVLSVTPNYFALLGVQPSAGRLLSQVDVASTPVTVALSERTWKQLFPERRHFDTATVLLNGEPRTVVGLLPYEADYPGSYTDVWQVAPSAQLPDMELSLFRLKDGVTPAQAEAELALLNHRIMKRSGDRLPHAGFRFRKWIQPQFKAWGFHLALIGGVVAVLLIACANLANLQLARGVARTRELATRAAVGASRGAIIRQLVTESAWLALGGLLLGAVLTAWGMKLVETSVPDTLAEYVTRPQMSWRVMVFAVTTTLFSLMTVGLFPALKLSRVDVNSLLKSGAGTGQSKKARRQYAYLVVVEVALALTVLCGSALLTRAAFSLHIEVPADYKQLASAFVIIRPLEGDLRRGWEWSEYLIGRLRAAPEISGAATSVGSGPRRHAVSADDPGGAPRVIPAPLWGYQLVSADFFRVMGIPIVKGRDFSPGEFAEPQVIVDQNTAALLWPGEDPIGRLVKLDSPHVKGPWLRVIGVAKSSARPWERERLRSAEPRPMLRDVWVLNAADTTLVHPVNSPNRRVGGSLLTVLVRTEGDARRLPPAMRRTLNPVAFAGVNTLRPETFEDQLARSVPRKKHDFIAALFAVFGFCALALAALGVYAIIAHGVAQRTREFGVRVAVGASAGEIRRLVLREGSLLALLGIAVGLIITWKTAGTLRAFLFDDYDRYDSRIFASVSLTLFAVAWLASWIPARRATRIDPVEALRND